MKFVQLILKEIIKIVVTRLQILKLHQIRFQWPRLHWGAYSAPQTR